MGVFDELIGHVVDVSFNTHEEMFEAALRWNMEEFQLNEGFFQGAITGTHTSHIQMAHTRRSGGVLIKGKSPRNCYLFSSSESAEGKITHNGLSVHTDELLVLAEKDEVDFTVSSAFTDVTFSIDKDFFDEAFKEYFNEPFSYDKVNKRISLKENTATQFRISLIEILRDMIAHNTDLQNNSVFHNKSEQDILKVLFQNIDLSRIRKDTIESEINANKIRLYIENQYTDNIKVNKYVNSEKFSIRTIRKSFKTLFGFSPKQYLQSYRLGKVHHSLLKNDSNLNTVENIAYDHGFAHMGRFSGNYKSMFGKTPSSTLKTIL